MRGMKSKALQFTLAMILGVITAIAVCMGLGTGLWRWGNSVILDVERDAARDRVLDEGSDTEYDRHLLGSEFDRLKAEHDRRVLEDLRSVWNN